MTMEFTLDDVDTLNHMVLRFHAVRLAISGSSMGHQERNALSWAADEALGHLEEFKDDVARRWDEACAAKEASKAGA